MSSLQYIDRAYNNAQGTRDAFGGLSDRLVSEGLPAMVSGSGDREHDVQVGIFVARYRQQAVGNGPYGDVRWWNGAADGYPGGTRWVRYSSAGTVAVPGSGNHEARRSNDLGWPYNAATPAHARARQLAPDYDITCEGTSFGEWWHWTYWGALGVIGQPAYENATPFPTEEEEDDMAQPFVKVTREGMPIFAVVGRGTTQRAVPTSEAALRGVDKILEAFKSNASATPTVTISGEEWDAGALTAFGVDS